MQGKGRTNSPSTSRALHKFLTITYARCLAKTTNIISRGGTTTVTGRTRTVKSGRICLHVKCTCHTDHIRGRTGGTFSTFGGTTGCGLPRTSTTLKLYCRSNVNTRTSVSGTIGCCGGTTRGKGTFTVTRCNYTLTGKRNIEGGRGSTVR